MSAGGAYDLAELRQRIAGSFSGAELRSLAHELGAAIGPGSSSPADLARDLVRHFERAHGLAELLGELRRRQPLVEWPSPGVGATFGEGPVDLSMDALPLVHPGELAELEPSDLDDEPTSIQEPPVSAPNAPPRLPPLSGAPELPPLSARAAGPGSAPVSGPWPGLVAPPREERSKGLDPRLLIVVSGLTLATAIAAFVAGISWSGGSSGSEASEGAPAGASAAPVGSDAPPGDATAPTARSEGIAGAAARALERGVLTVARKCEIADEGAPPQAIFAAANELCGPPPPGWPNERAGRARPRPGASPPSSVEPGEPPVNDGPQAITTTSTPAIAAPGGACLSRCSDEHGTCGGGCGPEPKRGSEYEEYQACQAKCLASYSKCRLRCQ